MNKFFSIFFTVSIILVISACTPFRAWNTQGVEKYEKTIATNNSRSEVERLLGQPIKTQKYANGVEAAIYKTRIDEGSGKYRAFSHAILDVATLFIWELAAPYTEDFFKEEHYITVYYDPSGRILKSEIQKVDS
jgi:hypothetical protein